MPTDLARPSGNTAIPSAQLSYVGQMLRNDLHDLTLRAFRDEGLTQADLAQRLGVDDAQASRWLGAPGHWTIETAARLLFAINRNTIAVGVHAGRPLPFSTGGR
jgi:hypothetical protein